MRVASRHMPKFTRQPAGLLAWVTILVLLAGMGYVAAAKPMALVFALAGFAVVALLGRKQVQRETRQLLALAALRDGQSICEFARDFEARSADTWVLRAVYEQLQAQLKHLHPAFPIRADDRLKEDLFLDEDDLDMDLAQQIEMRTGRSLDDAQRNPYYGKVETVRDLVLFFQHQHQHQHQHQPLSAKTA